MSPRLATQDDIGWNYHLNVTEHGPGNVELEA